MSRSAARRLEDILIACDAIDQHLRRSPADDPLADGLVFDAVRARLIEIGEAAKDLPTDRTAAEPDLPWREIAGMRDQLAHRYFDTSHAILTATVRNDRPNSAPPSNDFSPAPIDSCQEGTARCPRAQPAAE